MAQVMTFPRELERNLLRDQDYGFLIIWFITFILLNSLTYYAQTFPVKELTAEDVKKFTEAIYRVRVQREPQVAEVAEVRGSAETAEEVAAAVEEAPAELSAEERRAVREADRASRAAKAEARRQAIAERLKVLAGPTTRGTAGRRSGTSAREAVGLSGGGSVSGDLKGALAIVDDAATGNKVKKLRGGGAISEGIGDLSLDDLRGFLADPKNLESMLNEAPIKLSRKAITTRGKGSRTQQRSQQAISEVVLANKNQVQYCYWTYKRRDSSLRGQVQVEFTINPGGDVTRVRYRSSEWGRNPLQREIEKCIINIIQQWRFDAIEEADGDVTAGATFIFE